MNHYLNFTFEIISKFINYISEDITLDDLTEENLSEDNFINNDLITYILNELLFFKHFPRNDTEIMLNLKNNKFTYDVANEYLKKLLHPKLQIIQNVLPYESYEQILSLNEYLIILLKQNIKIEQIVKKNNLSFEIDYGFEFDYQNLITNSILRCLKSITNWLSFTMIEFKDIQFVEKCLIGNFNTYDLFQFNDNDLNNIKLIQPVLESILIKNDLYITSNASNQLCKLWIYLNNQPLSLRLICL